ncbi:unnamed protein product [Discosporangium mesarthrocarpum]
MGVEAEVGIGSGAGAVVMNDEASEGPSKGMVWKQELLAAPAPSAQAPGKGLLPGFSSLGNASQDAWKARLGVGGGAGPSPTSLHSPSASPPPSQEAEEVDEGCVEWMFGPRQAQWLSAGARAGARAGLSEPGTGDEGGDGGVGAAWRALDDTLSQAATVVLASRESRGTEYSSVWCRPFGLVWAKKAKNQYWPAMQLWGSGTNTALATINAGRVPPKFREELDRQARGKDKECVIVVEFFGGHDFALMKADAVCPLTNPSKSPNPKPPRHKRWEAAILEATDALASVQALEEDMVEPLKHGERGRSLGFLMNPTTEESLADTDTDTSSGESVSGSDTESVSSTCARPRGTVMPKNTLAHSTSSSPGAPAAPPMVVTGAQSSSWAALGAPAPQVEEASEVSAVPSCSGAPLAGVKRKRKLGDGAGKKKTEGRGAGRGGGAGAAGSVSGGVGAKARKRSRAKKVRALAAISKYLTKFQGMFMSPDMVAAAAAKQDEEAKLKAKGQRPPSVTPSPAAATVLGQRGLWGQWSAVMPSQEEVVETETTDDEDEDIVVFDSETPKSITSRKEALRKQEEALRKDIEVLNDRVEEQEKTLRNLGSPIPPVVGVGGDFLWRGLLSGSGPTCRRSKPMTDGDNKDSEVSC